MDNFTCNYDKRNKIWSSPGVPSIFNFDSSLGRIIFNQMKNYPNNICQIDDSSNITLTNREALTWAIRIAQHLQQVEFKSDDIIGFAVKNTTYVLPTVLGCFFNCIPIHAVNPGLDEATISHCFGLTKPKLIFCDGDNYQKIKEATKSYKPKIFTLSEHLQGIPNVVELLEPTITEMFYQPKQYAMAAQQTVVILSSSGTTGKPKAVCMSASTLIFDASFVTSESVLYMSSGIDWISGIAFFIASCLTGGTRVISNKPFSDEHFLELVKKYKVTITFLPPRNMAALVNNPLASKEKILSSLQIVQCGGSIVSEKLVKDFRKLLNERAVVLYGYAFTEFGGVSNNINCAQGVSVGKLAPSVQLRILDEDGNNLGPNETGEICVRNDKHWNGYYGNPIETQRMKDARGWFFTGDLGYMDDDNNLYVVDRKKEIRKYLGFHFWPKEIEDTITEMPDVLEACVVTIDDVTKGDCAGALVVKTPKSSLTDAQIIEYVKTRLVVVHKQIHAGVYFAESIPHNANGKMLRPEAKKIFESLRAA